MIEKLRIIKPWRYKGRLIHCGMYRVPRHMPEAMAEQAAREGYGKVERASSVQETETVNEAPKPKRQYRRKKEAPENKLLGPADENKSALD